MNRLRIVSCDLHAGSSLFPFNDGSKDSVMPEIALKDLREIHLLAQEFQGAVPRQLGRLRPELRAVLLKEPMRHL